MEGMGTRGRRLWKLADSEREAVDEYLAQSRAHNITQHPPHSP